MAATGTVGLNLLTTAINFISVLLLTRMLGPAGYGSFVFMIAWVTVLASPSKLGFDGLLVREVAVYKSTNEQVLLYGILETSHRFVLIASTFFSIVAFFVIISQVDSGSSWIILAVVLLIPVWAIMAIKQAAIRGLGHVIEGQLCEMIIGPSIFLVLIFLMRFRPFPILSAELAILLRLLAAISALTGVTILYRRLVIKNYLFKKVKEKQSIWLKRAIMFSFLDGTMTLQSRTGIIILGSIVGMEAVGIFALAMRAVDMMAISVKAATIALAPNIAKIFRAGDKERLQNMIRKSTRTVFLITFFFAFILILFRHEFLSLFGKGFVEGSIPLIILAVGRLPNAAFASVQMLLKMCGKEFLALKSGIFAVCINFTLSLILTPYFGTVGVAIGLAASRIGQMISETYWVRRYIGIKPGV